MRVLSITSAKPGFASSNHQSLHYESKIGEPIIQSVRAAFALSKENNCPVNFEFNSGTVEVMPQHSVIGILKRYYQSRTSIAKMLNQKVQSRARLQKARLIVEKFSNTLNAGDCSVAETLTVFNNLRKGEDRRKISNQFDKIAEILQTMLRDAGYKINFDVEKNEKTLTAHYTAKELIARFLEHSDDFYGMHKLNDRYQRFKKEEKAS